MTDWSAEKKPIMNRLADLLSRLSTSLDCLTVQTISVEADPFLIVVSMAGNRLI